MIYDIKYRFLDYFHHLTVYDYFAYTLVLVFFIFSILLSIMIGKKFPKIAIFYLFLSFLLTVSSPIMIKIFFDKTAKKVEILELKIKRLNFAKMLVVRGKLKSKAEVDFKKCRVFVSVIKEDSNKYKNILNNLKPKRYLSILLNKALKRGDSLDFKMDIKDFHPTYKYKTKVYGECY